jgi:hypothetical protein
VNFQHGDLALTEDRDGVVLLTYDQDEAPGLIRLTPDDLRWLITTGGPAALHAVGAAPQIRKGGPDAEGPEGS